MPVTKVKSKQIIRDDYLDLIMRLPLKPIRTKTELKAAHEIIDELAIIGEDDLTAGQMDYLLVLGDIATKYEETLEDNDEAISGLDMLKHLADANDLTASDIGRIIGQRELGSKVFRGDRAISKSHAAALGQHFGVPGEVFLRTV